MGISGPLAVWVLSESKFPNVQHQHRLQNCPKVYSLRSAFGESFPKYVQKEPEDKDIVPLDASVAVITCRHVRLIPSDMTARDGWILLTLQHTHTTRTHLTALEFITGGERSCVPFKRIAILFSISKNSP